MKPVLLFLLSLYQRAEASQALTLPGLIPVASCRFYPSCSHYAADSIRAHGTTTGIIKSFRRLVRCHPFSRGGIDLA